jgi:peptidyl-prolyl cis-trans isomerase SurA
VNVGKRSLAVVLLLAWSAVSAPAEVIDRILAVVEGQLVTLSDVRAVTRLGLESASPNTDAVQDVLEKLIDRQLMLIEVDRYAPPEPSTSEVDAQFQIVQKRYADALGLEIALGQVGWARDDVRRYVRDELRIERYLQQRFTATIQPTDDEVAAYYRLHADEFTRGGSIAPYAAVREDVRTRLIAERRSILVREWLTGLRRRANIQQLYFATPPASVTG